MPSNGAPRPLVSSLRIRYTATRLAEGLRVSPAAISGAMRYLLDARRLHGTREFFAFMQQEIDAMMPRGRVHREETALAEQ